MIWIRSHPYISALCAAALTILAGAWVVQKKSMAPVSNTATTWGGNNLGVLDPTSHTPTQNTGTPKRHIGRVQDNAPYTYIPPAVLQPSPGAIDSFDLNEFISTLTQSTQPPQNPPTGAIVEDTYSLIPTNLISTTAPKKTLSATQQAVYDYGNYAGSYIQSFEQQNPTAAVILKDQAEDRGDPAKAAAVRYLARSLEDVGNNLVNNITDVPGGVAAAHTTLAKNYIETGKKLALVPEATNDTEFLSAIEAYNASADTLVKNYVSLATILSAYGIVFDPNDAGSVFTFTQGAL